MAVSEQEIEPDLNKAPPHIEGELLKQNSKAVISKWRQYYFVVHRDKLRYFSKKEDPKAGKDPVNVIRLLRVSDISESVFNKVPRKVHLNSGFSITELTSQGEQVYNLLAESPDMMRYWVHALRYIKAYWSKKEVRETVLSEELERKLLEQVLREEENDEGDEIVGEVSLEGQDPENKYVNIPVHFADSSKCIYKLSFADKVSDLLEKTRDKLTSSAAQIWIVDNQGKEYSLDPEDSLGLYQPSTQQFFAVDPTHRVIVVFIGNSKEFVTTVVPFKTTAQEVIEDPAIAPKLDIEGIANRGLFLKKNTMAELFQSNECPCDALYTEKNGRIQKYSDVGHLLIMNKALDRGRPSKWVKHPKAALRSSTTENETDKNLQAEWEEEEVQQRALVMVQKKRKRILQRDYRPIPQTQVTPEETEENPNLKGSYTPPIVRRELDPAIIDKSKRSQTEVSRIRSKAFVKATLSPNPSPPRSPVISPRRISNSPVNESDFLSKEPPGDIFDDVPTENPQGLSSSETSPQTKKKGDGNPPGSSSGENSPLVRRRAVRSRHGHTSPFHGRHPPQASISRRSGTILAEHLTADDSRSSLFAATSSIRPGVSGDPSNYPTCFEEDEEQKRMDQLFSTSFQGREEEERIKAELEKQSSKTEIIHRDTWLSEENEESKEEKSEPEVELPSAPLFIQFDSLRKEEGPNKGQGLRPIVIHRPSILKVILLQSEASGSPSRKREMDAMSLSGVVLRLNRGIWELQEGSNFHDPVSIAEDKESKLENYPLPGGIVAVYNHTKECWYVLPPPQRVSPVSSPTRRTDYDSDAEALRLFAQQQYLQKRAIATEIGSAFHEILEQFKTCKSSEEKKKVASDMANETIGHMIRGRFCTSLAYLLLDGMKVQKLGFVQQDVWKVINAFCQEGLNLYSVSSSNIYATIESRVLKPIKGESRLTHNHMRFRAFICLCISRGVFVQWLTDLPLLKETVKKYYGQDSLLYLASIARDPAYEKVYEEILLSLQPLPFIPLELSLSFEVQKPSELTPNMAGNRSRSVSPAPSPIPMQSTGAKSVNESTGQRRNETVTAIVNESFSEDQSKPRQPQTSSAKKVLDSLTINRITTKTPGQSWLKSLTDSISNLNMGGAITGTPSKQVGPSTPIPPAVPTISTDPPQEEKHECYDVEALFDNFDVGTKELKFQKGDTLQVKYSVDENWLLCVKGDISGIVPVNYVKKIC